MWCKSTSVFDGKEKKAFYIQRFYHPQIERLYFFVGVKVNKGELVSLCGVEVVKSN